MYMYIYWLASVSIGSFPLTTQGRTALSNCDWYMVTHHDSFAGLLEVSFLGGCYTVTNWLVMSRNNRVMCT